MSAARVPAHSEATAALEKESARISQQAGKTEVISCPIFMACLLAEKARLETARTHIAAAAAWARASKKTL